MIIMLINYYKRSLVDLFARVQEVRDRPLEQRRNCLGIQEDLLRRVVYVEKRIKHLRAEIKELKGTLSGKGPVRLSKAEARQAKDRMQLRRQNIEEYREILYLLKSVGDALAFIYFSKWDIKPMAFKENSGHMHGKEGLWHELNLLRVVFEVDGAVAILNDLTNSLRYGDLMVVSKGYWGPIEAKSSYNTSPRAKVQQTELEKMHRYLVEDQTEELYGIPGVTVRSDLLVEERDHVDDLNEIIRVAYKEGFAFSEVEEGLYYYICYDSHSGGWDLENDMPGGFHLLLEEFKSKQPLFFFVNQNKFNTQGRYPYTLSIRDPQALFDFYSGRLHVNVVVDVEAMSAKFESSGFKMTFVEDDDVALTITNTDPDKAADRWDFAVSRHFFERVAYEFLSLDWLVEENARRTDFSAFTDHELSGLQVVEGGHVEDERTPFALSQARQLALRRRSRADREGNT